MKIVVTGGRGLVGRHLACRGVAAGHDVVALRHEELDVCSGDSIARALDAHAPGLVIHAAAIADVDRAEREARLAFEVNDVGAGQVAEACVHRDIAMLALSTDYVFAGTAGVPYSEDDVRAPVNSYGASKAAGEDRVLAAGGAVIRTSWVFAADGDGFANRIVQAAWSGVAVKVVADQHGTPTWADDLADALIALAEQGVGHSTSRTGGGHPGSVRILHVANEGPVSRYELARAIVDAARRAGAKGCEVEAVTSDPTPGRAPRPRYSALDTSRVRALGIAMPHWRSHLDELVQS